MELYFVRHGQSSNNRLATTTGSDSGRSDDPTLTDVGIQQAHALARTLTAHVDDSAQGFRNIYNLSGFGITHLYCSLMVRAVHTASIIGDALGLRPVAWPDLHEVGGIYLDMPDGTRVGQPGKNREFFESRYPRLVLQQELSREGWHEGRAYEEIEDREPRVSRWYEDLVLRHGDTKDHVLVVSHGAFLAHFMRLLLRMPLFSEHAVWFDAANCSITRVDFGDGFPNVQYMNRFDFIPPELIT